MEPNSNPSSMDEGSRAMEQVADSVNVLSWSELGDFFDAYEKSGQSDPPARNDDSLTLMESLEGYNSIMPVILPGPQDPSSTSTVDGSLDGIFQSTATAALDGVSEQVAKGDLATREKRATPLAWFRHSSDIIVTDQPSKRQRFDSLRERVALQRRPRDSKKNSRASVSELFLSLQISAEQFAHLQDGAKCFMLNENHLERRECVGTAKKVNNVAIQQKMIACVEYFLLNEGWGEQCWGLFSEGHNQSNIHWPADKNKIIALVAPLLRRAVTNERARQRRLDVKRTRGLSADTSEGSTSSTIEASETPPEPSPLSLDHPRGEKTITRSATPTALDAIFPPTQSNHNSSQFFSDISSEPSPLMTVSAVSPIGNKDNSGPISNTVELMSAFPQNGSSSGCDYDQESVQISLSQQSYNALSNIALLFSINILRRNRRICPEFTLAHIDCFRYSQLLFRIQESLSDATIVVSRVRALGPDGLVVVADEQGWDGLVGDVKMTEWMDGIVKVIVDVTQAEAVA